MKYLILIFRTMYNFVINVGTIVTPNYMYMKIKKKNMVTTDFFQ